MKMIFCILLIIVNPLFAYRYELAVCAIFQDEARFLKEWIDYHIHMGVEHFYLFNNNSKDNFREVLRPYIKSRLVTLIDWPFDYTTGEEWNLVQCQAYSEAVKMAKKVCHWLALIDTDEFIVPVKKRNILHVLNDFDKASAVAVNWVMYGTSHVYEVTSQDRMTYSLILRADDNAPEHLLIKSIVQPDKTDIIINNPHCCNYLVGYCVNTDWRRIESAVTPYPAIDQLRINHYWTRDEKFMYECKIPRRNKMYKDNPDLILNNNIRYNVIFDDLIKKRW